MKIKNLPLTFAEIAKNNKKHCCLAVYCPNQKFYSDSYKYICTRNENIIEVYVNDELLYRYHCDNQGRLVREDNKKFGLTFTTEYDEKGNILSKSEYSFSLCEELGDKLAGHSYRYSRDFLVGYDDENFDYDGQGRPTTYRNEVFKWNGNLLISIGDLVKYKYNSNDVRFQKICTKHIGNINEEVTKFYLNNNKILVQINDEVMYFHYDDDVVCGFTIESSDFSRKYWYKKDIWGNIVGIYDDSNALICEYVYDAWGNHKILIKVGDEYVDINSNFDFDETSLFYAYIAINNPFRFREYYFDKEMGLYYFDKRYYDPEIGRFINPKNNFVCKDNILCKDKIEKNYQFCSNDYLNKVNGNGNFFESLINKN